MRRQEESEVCWIIEIPFFSFHDDLDFDFNEYYADISTTMKAIVNSLIYWLFRPYFGFSVCSKMVLLALPVCLVIVVLWFWACGLCNAQFFRTAIKLFIVMVVSWNSLFLKFVSLLLLLRHSPSTMTNVFLMLQLILFISHWVVGSIGVIGGVT